MSILTAWFLLGLIPIIWGAVHFWRDDWPKIDPTRRPDEPLDSYLVRLDYIRQRKRNAVAGLLGWLFVPAAAYVFWFLCLAGGDCRL